MRINGVLIDQATTTKILFKWDEFDDIAAGSVDSDANPSGFTREATGWRINLGALNLTPAIYKMAIIVYSSAYPQGKVYSPADQTIIEIVAV